MSPPKQFDVSSDLLQRVINYLTTKPWFEVNGLLIELGQEMKKGFGAQDEVKQDVNKGH